MRKLLVRLVYWGGSINRVTGWRLSRFNRWIYKLSGGALGNTLPGARVILLTTTGRRSGKPHTVPVCSWTDGDDLIVGDGAGGLRTQPQWFLNLRADPRVTVQLKRDVFGVAASVLTEAERESFLEHSAPMVRFYDGVFPRRPSLVRLRREV